LLSNTPTNSRKSWKKKGYLMRLKERRGWILVALPVMTLVFTYLHIDRTVHIDLGKPTQMSRTKATWEEKNENRELAKQYAWVAFGWRGREWLCLHDLWTRQALSELLNSLEREVESLHSKYCEAYVTLTSVMDHLVRLTGLLLEKDTTKIENY
jgi:hypothetical protein